MRRVTGRGSVQCQPLSAEPLAGQRSSIIATVVAALGAFAVAALLVTAGAYAADRYGWCCIHAWALMHGMILVLFPGYLALSYLCLRPLAETLLGGGVTLRGPGTRKMSWLAVSSLLLSGIGFLVPVIGSIPALVCGHTACRRFRAQPTQRGYGLAVAGLVIGYTALAYSIYVFAMVFWAASHAS